MTGRTHAIVLGAGIAGLCAAGVLAKHFEQVTLVERDLVSPLVDGQSRRGVPQGMHVSLLTMRAMQQLEELFPGLLEECLADGAQAAEAGTQVRAVFHGHLLRQSPAGTNLLLASRPFLEGKIRARVLKLPAVTLLEDTRAAGLLADGRTKDHHAIRGVRLHSAKSGTASSHDLEADLVLDATGRGGRSGAWLEQHGFPRAPEQRVRIDVIYASRHFALPPDVLGTDRAVVIGATASHPHGMTFVAQENGSWVLSLQKYGNHGPPTDDDSFLTLAATVAPDDVMHHLRHAAPLGPIAHQRFPHATRRRFDRMHSFPGGMLVIGDALCSINPIYGSGMAMAVAQAAALDACLATETGPLARQFFRAAHRVTNPQWWLAACGDYSLTQGNQRARLLSAAFQRITAAAEHDPAISATVVRLFGMIDSPRRLARPHVLRQLLVAGRQRR
ncbi:FAD-dependent monooxygenase [Streptomyces sp. NPDC086554]|uniref:FAD-dependent oxidoreductase n=1 Tax=Streptomyces sp. NPDC086554 TaxID=3154864 RepID=UPI00344753FE